MLLEEWGQELTGAIPRGTSNWMIVLLEAVDLSLRD